MSYRAGTLAVAAALIAAVPAQAATTEYPAGGSHFAGDQEGWAGSGQDCSGTGLGSPLCSTTTVWDTVGNPSGSITMRMSVTANVLNTFTGTGIWTSPAFTVPSGQAVTGATFAYDRQLASGSLLSLAPESHVTVELVDQAGGTPPILLEEDLTTANSAFATSGAGAPAGAVVEGHSYRLRITTETSTSTASLGLLGQENTRFDNVVLAVDQATSGGGGGGGGGGGAGTGQGTTTPVVSEGVTVVKTFRTDTQIEALFRRFDEGTKVGTGPGGSLIPRDLCTIVGTSRADRITGTSGNDVICGLGGNDRIDGAGGIDIIDGAKGKDRLFGGPARDKLIGLAGADRLNGNAGNDRVGGGAGHDRLLGARGKDLLSARDRTRDIVNGGAGKDRAKVDRRARGARRTKAALRRADRVRKVERLV
jgi:Ca2+-binding RTX toxin-like protein